MTTDQKNIISGVGAAVITLIIAAALFGKRKSKRTKIVVDYRKFDSPDSIDSGNCIDPKLIRMLYHLAKKTRLPVFEWISSGVRTPYWNKKVGGVANSSHQIPVCKAVDIRVPNHNIRMVLVYAAKEVGFRRIGVGNSFIHLDIDTTKKQNIAWGYPSGTPAKINPFV